MSTLLAASIALLPYAPSHLIFQSPGEIKNACVQFEPSADADLDRFIQLSSEGNYTAAYEIWSELLFRYFSFQIEMSQTYHHSSNEQVKDSVNSEKELLEKAFQHKLLVRPDLLNTFLQNAEASAHLTPQHRLFTANILKEYQKIFPNEAPRIAVALQHLSKEKTEAFQRSHGLAAPVDADTLSELKVLTANIICFSKSLGYVFGGISPWKGRIDRLVEIIHQADAQIVCLQEVWDPEAMRALIERLKNTYTFFVYNAGDPAGTLQVDKMGFNSGLFIASKLPFDSLEFNPFPHSIPEGSNRGALIATCRVAHKHFTLISTHLQHGNSLQMRQLRQQQLFLSYTALQEAISRELPSSSWGCLTGDLNIDAFSSDFNESGFSRLFSIPYTEQISHEKATCTNYFNDLVITPLGQRPEVRRSYELIDYCVRPALSYVEVSSEQTLIPLFSFTAPAEALSDHQALLTTWRVASPGVNSQKP